MRLLMLTAESMPSAFTSSGDRKRSIPSTSSPPNGSRLRRSDAESNDSFMFRGLVPMLARNRCISESAVRANWRFEKHLLMPF